jgi:hypothetical protein
MTDWIVTHNRLNGVAFSTAEFVFVAAVAVWMAVAFAIHGTYLGTALLAGTALNALVVAVFGVRDLRRGERGSSWRQLRDAEYRARARAEHPALVRDTLLLTAATLAPYVLSVGVLVESLRGR